MATRPKSDAGKPVTFSHTGRFAGRWYCLTAGCPMSISDYDHRQGRRYCRQCARAEGETAADFAAAA